MEDNFRHKYLKYKSKYINTRQNMVGGGDFKDENYYVDMSNRYTCEIFLYVYSKYIDKGKKLFLVYNNSNMKNTYIIAIRTPEPERLFLVQFISNIILLIKMKKTICTL